MDGELVGATDAVLAGAWRLPAENRVVLIFANMSDKPVTAKLAVDAGTFGVPGAEVRVTRVTAEGPGETFTTPGKFERELTFAPASAWAWELTDGAVGLNPRRRASAAARPGDDARAVRRWTTSGPRRAAAHSLAAGTAGRRPTGRRRSVREAGLSLASRCPMRRENRRVRVAHLPIAVEVAVEPTSRRTTAANAQPRIEASRSLTCPSQLASPGEAIVIDPLTIVAAVPAKSVS